MKAYGLDLRERVVGFVKGGGSKVEAAKRFRVARKTVYNYLTLVKTGALAPKESWGSWKKFDPAKVRAYVAKHPDATLWEIGRAFRGLAQAGRNAGLWPVASEQTGALLITLAIAVKTHEPLRIPLRAAGLPVLVGASGMAATLAYFYATHFSMLAIAAVLVSLYPGVTVLLARTLLHERFTPAQRAGLGLCALAIAAIALN